MADAAAGASAGTEKGTMPTGTILTSRFSAAFDQARVLHVDFRKIAEVDGAQPKPPIPYLSHPMIVAATVLEYGGTEDDAIAALLHDAAEDAGGEARITALRAEFGETVAAIVESLSDSMLEAGMPKADWWDRKVAYIDHLEHGSAPAGAYLVCAADKLANLTATRIDRSAQGPSIWKIFKTGRPGQVWYYTRLTEVLGHRVTTARGRQLVERLASEVAALRDDIVGDPREAITRAGLEAEFESALAKGRETRVELGLDVEV